MESTAPKPFVFVLMPFGPEFDDVYQLGIKAACQEAGAHCERVDEQIYQENMLARICDQISQSNIIIADMSGKNPNVFFEVGYAFSEEKTIILLCKSGEDLPFDLKQRQHIFYSKIIDLKPELSKHINHYLHDSSLDGSSDFSGDEGDQIACYLNNVRLLNGAIVEIFFDSVNDIKKIFLCNLNFKIENHSSQLLSMRDMSFEFVLPNYFRHSEFGMYDILKFDYLKECSKFVVNMSEKIIPRDWVVKRLALQVMSDPKEFSGDRCQLNIYSVSRKINLSFKLTYSSHANP
uniref:Nucleoside 2-deoxyribosyltransferase n=1 Tax=Desulfovibrio sp. U5L TaxID=596152 RepID=I2PXH4_9BACT